MSEKVAKTFIGFIISFKAILAILVVNIVVWGYHFALFFRPYTFDVGKGLAISISFFLISVEVGLWYLLYNSWKSKLKNTLNGKI